jgi:hypothetical protein
VFTRHVLPRHVTLLTHSHSRNVLVTPPTQAKLFIFYVAMPCGSGLLFFLLVAFMFVASKVKYTLAVVLSLHEWP